MGHFGPEPISSWSNCLQKLINFIFNSDKNKCAMFQENRTKGAEDIVDKKIIIT